MGYVTREMIDRAKEMDLLTYLQTYEPQELVHFGGSTYCTREHDSLKISNGKWCWFSRGIGGRTALDYLIKVKEIPFTEAVERIVGRAAERPPISCTRQQPERTKALLLPQVSRCAAHAVEYLHSRGIDYELIDFCIRTGRLYESYPHHNAVFVGKDKDGQPAMPACEGLERTSKGKRRAAISDFPFPSPPRSRHLCCICLNRPSTCFPLRRWRRRTNYRGGRSTCCLWPVCTSPRRI